MTKFTQRHSFVFAICVVLLASTACKHKNDPQPDLLLQKTWIVKKVEVDGMDKTSAFSNMTLKFSPGKYTATNGGDVWADNGTWSYAKNSSTLIIRGDGVQVTISEITEKNLQLNFTWLETTFKGGRIMGIKGNNTFMFE